VEDRFGCPEHAFPDLEDVCLLKIGEGLIIDEGDRGRKRMLEVKAYYLVGAFRHLGNGFQDLKVIEIIIDVEVLGLVTAPVKSFVVDFILAVVDGIDNLAIKQRDAEDEEQGKKDMFFIIFHGESPFILR